MRQHLFYIALFRQKEIVGRVVLSTLVPALSHELDDDHGDDHDGPIMTGNKSILFEASTP